VVETGRLAVELGNSYRSPQNYQLISERRILGLGPGSRLEREAKVARQTGSVAIIREAAGSC
jgi:hypothetical protein